MITGRRLGPVPLRATGLVAALVFASSHSAAGQQEQIDSPYRWIERGFRVGVYGGYVAANRGKLDFGPGSAATIGARLRTRVSSPLSLEIGLAAGSANRHVIDPRLVTGPAPVETVASDWAMIEAALQMALTGARTWHGVQPYLIFGTGLLIGVNQGESQTFADSTLSDFRYRLGTAPMFQAGFGAETFLSERLGLGVELRDKFTRLKPPSGFFRTEVLQIIQDLGVEAPQNTEWTNNFEFSVALWYYF
ncbi:MAG: outer membrane beta-barrel protein [Gemmatimonadota bacterium]